MSAVEKSKAGNEGRGSQEEGRHGVGRSEGRIAAPLNRVGREGLTEKATCPRTYK